LPTHGTLEEIFEQCEREVLPELTPKTQVEHGRYIKHLRKQFGAMRYAKNEVASSVKFLRNASHEVLNEQAAKRPVAANREVQALSRIFHIAKARWA
jgi:hypothetical protein